MVAQRFLVPFVEVRILVGQPIFKITEFSLEERECVCLCNFFLIKWMDSFIGNVSLRFMRLGLYV